MACHWRSAVEGTFRCCGRYPFEVAEGLPNWGVAAFFTVPFFTGQWGNLLRELMYATAQEPKRGVTVNRAHTSYGLV